CCAAPYEIMALFSAVRFCVSSPVSRTFPTNRRTHRCPSRSHPGKSHLSSLVQLPEGKCGTFPSSAEEGAKREPDRAKPQYKTGNVSAGLTTRPLLQRWLRDILLTSRPPLLCEEGNSSHRQVNRESRAGTKSA